MNIFSYAYVMTFVILNHMINHCKVSDNQVSTNGPVAVKYILNTVETVVFLEFKYMSAIYWAKQRGNKI